MSDPQLVSYERRGRAALVTLRSPSTRNALSAALLGELLGALRRAQTDEGARAIVLTGEGRAFCAGADLKAGGDMGGGDHAAGSPFVEVLRLLRDGDKPVVCAVNGAAFGGGIGLVAASDIALGAESATFSFSEVRLGVVPAMISVVVLPKLGLHHALRLFLTAERFGASEAVHYGLLHRAVPGEQLLQAAFEQVDALARGGPRAIAAVKQLLRRVPTLPEGEAFAYTEQLVAGLFASEEATEGIRAFLEKRAPAWASPAEQEPS